MILKKTTRTSSSIYISPFINVKGLINKSVSVQIFNVFTMSFFKRNLEKNSATVHFVYSFFWEKKTPHLCYHAVNWTVSAPFSKIRLSTSRRCAGKTSKVNNVRAHIGVGKEHFPTNCLPLDVCRSKILQGIFI